MPRFPLIAKSLGKSFELSREIWGLFIFVFVIGTYLKNNLAME
jgi:hypothetical protein